MQRFRIYKAVKIVLLIAIATLVFGEVVMHLWNWLMPSIFGLRALTFGQALGLLVLTKLLFGGFHRHGGRRGWRRHMEERWAQMSPEQRERFRSGTRGWRDCGFGNSAQTGSEPTSV